MVLPSPERLDPTSQRFGIDTEHASIRVSSCLCYTDSCSACFCSEQGRLNRQLADLSRYEIGIRLGGLLVRDTAGFLKHLSQALRVAALEVIFVLADPLASQLPALPVLLPPLVRLGLQGRPVCGVIVLEVEVAVVNLPELLRRNPLPQVLVELHLFSCHGVDEAADELEECADIPGHLGDQRATEALRVVVLEDVEDGLCLAVRRYVAGSGAFEVDEEGGGLLASRSHVDNAVKHEAQMVDLAVGHFGVLLARAEVQARAGVVVVTKDDLLASLVLRRDVIVRECVRTVLPAPAERRLQTAKGVWSLPFRCTEIAQETFAGQPHALVVGYGRLRGVLGGARGQRLPLRDLREDRSILGLLLGRQRRRLTRFGVRRWYRYGSFQWAIRGCCPFLQLLVSFGAGDCALR